MIKLIFKIIVLLVLIFFVLQIEHNGRKLHTYVTEYLSSFFESEKEEFKVKKEKVTNPEISDSDVKELQKVLEE